MSPSCSITCCSLLMSPWHPSGNYFGHKSLKSDLLLTWPVTGSSMQTVKGLFLKPFQAALAFPGSCLGSCSKATPLVAAWGRGSTS